MIEAEPNTELPSDDAVLWRYMDTHKFASMLDTGCLHFSYLAAQTGDDSEGRLPQASADALEDHYAGLPGSFQGVSARVDSITRTSTAINCWTMLEEENFGFWEEYVGVNQAGVALRTSWGQLKRCFEAVEAPRLLTVGKVRYVNKDSLPPEGMQFVEEGVLIDPDHVFYKEEKYKFEQELRVMCHRHDRTIVNGVKIPQRETCSGVLVEIHLGFLAEEIVLSPWMDKVAEWEVITQIKRHHMTVPQRPHPVVRYSNYCGDGKWKEVGLNIDTKNPTPMEAADAIGKIIQIFRPFTDMGWAYRGVGSGYHAPAVYRALSVADMPLELEVSYHLSGGYYIIRVLAQTDLGVVAVEFKDGGLNPEPLFTWVDEFVRRLSSAE